MDVDQVARMIMQGMTHRDISDWYKNRFPARKGYSERSVRRFCKLHDIHKPSGTCLDNIVKASVQEVKRSIFHEARYDSIFYRLDIRTAEGCSKVC